MCKTPSPLRGTSPFRRESWRYSYSAAAFPFGAGVAPVFGVAPLRLRLVRHHGGVVVTNCVRLLDKSGDGGGWFQLGHGVDAGHDAAVHIHHFAAHAVGGGVARGRGAGGGGAGAVAQGGGDVGVLRVEGFDEGRQADGFHGVGVRLAAQRGDEAGDFARLLGQLVVGDAAVGGDGGQQLLHVAVEGGGGVERVQVVDGPVDGAEEGVAVLVVTADVGGFGVARLAVDEDRQALQGVGVEGASYSTFSASAVATVICVWISWFIWRKEPLVRRLPTNSFIICIILLF